MKRIIVSMVCAWALLFFGASAWHIMPATAQGTTKEKVLAFAWEQELAPDFGGWYLYEVGQGDGTSPKTYTKAATVPFVQAQDTYTTQYTIQAPAGATTVKTYVLTAFDTSGNESAFSNEATVSIDFQAPAVPINLRITVQAK